MALVASLASHRAGFAAEAHGDLAAARSAYGAALAGIERCLDDRDLAGALEARAESLPRGRVSAAFVARSFLLCLPDWLIDAHLARSAAAFGRRDLPVTRMHWDLVLTGEAIGRKSYRRSVEDCRTWMESRFVGDPSDTARIRADKFQSAERLLLVDPGNDGVRRRLVNSYATSLYAALDRDPRDGAGRSTVTRMPKRSSRGALSASRLSRCARSLRRHASRLARIERDAEERDRLATTFQVLVSYWGQEGDSDQAERTQRAARRARRPPPPQAADPARPSERPDEHRPVALDKNPFGVEHDPYDANPFDILGVQPGDDDAAIKRVVTQMTRAAMMRTGDPTTVALSSNGAKPDPRVAQRQLEDHTLRLTYDLMRLASSTPAHGGEP